MLFLALETSCDETAASVFTEEPAVLSTLSRRRPTYTPASVA
jgi:tRNA A37 threonylcarbamoyltransferase TsaD